MGRFIVETSLEQKIKQISLVFLLLFYSVSSLANTLIKSISFEGNFVTEEALLLREMYIKEGDVLDLAKVEASIQAIMDLGLFKSVNYYIAEDFIQLEEGSDEAHLVILLEEKYYLLILPRLRVDEDETKLGIQLLWDNIFGLNHKMRFLVEDRGTTEGVHEQRQRIKYSYPNINGSRFSLSFQMTNRNDLDEDDIKGFIDRRDQHFGIGLFKWLNPRGRNRGWFAGVGFNYRLRENIVLSGLFEDNELDAIVIGLQYGFKNVHQYEYNRGGKEFGYNLDISHHSLGSESEFFQHLLFYKSYYQFKSRPGDNLNVQTLLGYSTNDVMGNEAFSLGSSGGLRGYDSGRFEGNTKLLLNVEYLTPDKGYSALRYVYFVDIGNTYNDISDIRHKHLNTGAGFGIRWKIKAFVKVDLRIDVGYGFADENYHVSFGTRHAF